ncbi:ABC transporter ATP-binding protein [Asaia astilbis]
MAVLTTENLSYSFAGRTVLRDLSLHFEAGALISIMGANGAGKTTLLRLMLGLLRPETGRVLYQGKALTSLSRRQIARAMAYVPQRREALPAYTVAQVVELGRLPHGSLTRSLSEEERQEIDTVLSHLDLHSLRDRPCLALSGGEYQRVLLARALVQQTGILVLDEPLSGLDYGHQIRFMGLLALLAKEGRLVIMTAHQPDLVYRHTSHVVLLEQGRVLAEGAPGDVLDGARLSAFYGVALRHHDYGDERFFVSGEPLS